MATVATVVDKARWWLSQHEEAPQAAVGHGGNWALPQHLTKSTCVACSWLEAWAQPL